MHSTSILQKLQMWQI